MIPGIGEGLVDKVPVLFPGGVWPSVEQLGNCVPLLPLLWSGGYESGGESASDSDVDLFTAFNSPNEFGCVLAKFSESYRVHCAMVAQVLQDEKFSASTGGCLSRFLLTRRST